MEYEELKKISLECAEKVKGVNTLGYLAHALPFTIKSVEMQAGIELTLSLIEACGYEVVKNKEEEA